MVQYMLVRGSAQSTVYTVGRCEIYIIIHNFSVYMYVCYSTYSTPSCYYVLIQLFRWIWFHHSLIKGTPVRDGFMTNLLYSIFGIFQQMRMTLEGHLQMCWDGILYMCLWRKENKFSFFLSRWKCKNALHIFSAKWLKPSPNQSILDHQKICPFHPTLFRRMTKTASLYCLLMSSVRLHV